MLYPFYTRIKQMNMLVHITDMYVPDNMPEYHLPLPVPPRLARKEGDIAFYESPYITFKRMKSEYGDCFIREQDMMVASSGTT